MRLQRADKVKKEASKIRRSPGKEMMDRQVEYFEGFKGKGGASGCEDRQVEAAGGVVPPLEGGASGHEDRQVEVAGGVIPPLEEGEIMDGLEDVSSQELETPDSALRDGRPGHPYEALAEYGLAHGFPTAPTGRRSG